MTISEAISQLQREKREQITSRFPCRAILVKNIKQYSRLLDRLHEIGNVEFVSSGDLCLSEDTMPQYKQLTDKQYRDKWIVLTGVSEYLRFYSANEAVSQRFGYLWHFQPEDVAENFGRVIIPLWGSEQLWYNAELGLNADTRKTDYIFDCIDEDDEEQRFNCLVLSDKFQANQIERLLRPRKIFGNLREWLDYWKKPNPVECNYALITKCYAYIRPVTGTVTIQLVDTILTFLQNILISGESLTEKNCPTEAQNLLVQTIKPKMSLDEAILQSLNAVTFDSYGQVARWQSLSLGEQQLLWLWIILHPDDSYLYHCAVSAASFDELPSKIMTEVFSYREAHTEWVKESQQLIRKLNMQKTDAFFACVDKIPIFEERIPFLMTRSREEKIYLLRMVGKWMKVDAKQVRDCTLLREAYPELYAYLGCGSIAYDKEADKYFTKYKTYKLENTLPGDEALYFGAMETENYEARYALLASNIDDDSIVLWIDAMGAEWLPVLLWAIQEKCDGKIILAKIAQATLPTETCYNEQWNQMNVEHSKKDGLDKLAHKGVVDDPDYYSCVEQQLAFIEGVVLGKGGINELLKQKHRVIITGDHGTSRLAARFFHERSGIPAPKGAEIGSFGRFYAVQDGAAIVPLENTTVVKGEDGKRYVVFRNYNHYMRSGFATGADDENATYGEIHGGGSPEEVLVPVVVVDSKYEIPLKADWAFNPVKISMQKVIAALRFARPVQQLEVSAGPLLANVFPSKGKANKEWTVEFFHISKGLHPIQVKADGRLIEVDDLNVKAALGDDEDDF